LVSEARKGVEYHINEFNKIRNTLQDVKELLEDLKRGRTEMLEFKNTYENFTYRLDRVEEKITHVEDRTFEMLVSDRNIEISLVKTEEKIQALWDTIKRPNIRLIGIPEREEIKAGGITNLFSEIIAENFPDLGEDMNFQVQDAFRTPRRYNRQSTSPRHIIITLSRVQDKERILKSAREKCSVTFKGKRIRLTADFSEQTLNARSAWNDVFQVLKENNCQPRLLYPARLSFKIEGEIKTFQDKDKLREFMTTRPALQKMLKGILCPEKEK
jgi:hypothetical protein